MEQKKSQMKIKVDKNQNKIIQLSSNKKTKNLKKKNGEYILVY